jgi:hypothetical protein
MTTGQIVAIVVLVLLVALVVAAVMIFRRRSPSQRRLEAAQARREAEVRSASAARLEAEAEQRAERARAEQAQAEELAAMARHDREVAREQQERALKLDPEFTESEAQPAVASGPTARPAVERSTDRPAREPEPAARHDHDRPVEHPDSDHDARTTHGDDTHGDDTHRDNAARPDRSTMPYQREPIVAGAAAGMLKPRHDRPNADGATADAPPAVPLQRATPVDEPEQRRTVGEFVRDKTPHSGSTAHAAQAHPEDRTDAGTEQPAQSPVRSFADRILGRH